MYVKNVEIKCPNCKHTVIIPTIEPVGIPFAGEIDREILALAPGFEQVFVMRTFRISRLTRAVCADRIVPITAICNDAERGA